MDEGAWILLYLRKRGITVRREGEELIASPSSLVNDDVVALLEQNGKSVLEALLEEDPDPRGLVARWSRAFGYVSIYDPFLREWWDVATKDAPSWAASEAVRRKALRKRGNRRSYELTSEQLEALWASEQPEEEGIVEEFPVEEENSA